MTVLQQITAYIANNTATLEPVTLPLAPVTPLADFLLHITTTHVHPVYFPFLRFGAIHAARCTLVWASITQCRKRPVSVLQDLFGYLVLTWGGGTLVSILLSQPPSWLIDPTPWLIYPSVYFALVQTGLAGYMVQTAPTLINLFGAYIDGITRGTTIAALPKTLAASQKDPNVWTTALLSGIAVSGGGWLIQGLGLHEDVWKIGRPAVLNGGLLDTLDLWGGCLTGVIYAALVGSHSELEPITRILGTILPTDLRVKTAGAGVVEPSTARAISVLILGSLLAARVVTKFFLELKSRPAVKGSKVEVDDEFTDKKEVAVVKAPVEVGAGTRVTPRKKAKDSGK